MEGQALTAVARNDLEHLSRCCKWAYQGQYNLEEVDNYGNTPLLRACYLGRLEAARMLLRYGANIKAINYLGQNALTLATFAGDLDIVMDLLEIRSLHDFNLSSVIPAYCVAILRRHQQLIKLFWDMDRNGCWMIKSSHGLSGNDIEEMLHSLSKIGITTNQNGIIL